MKFLNKYFYIAALLLVGTACEPDLSDELIKADNGNAQGGALNVSRYVAVGNSLTAGFADGALYAEVQELSYPNIIAQRLEMIGGGAFTQPTIGENGFGTDASGLVGYLQTESLDLTDPANPIPVIARNSAVDAADALTKAAGSDFNNLGVPGIRVADVSIQGYGNSLTSTPAGNPYFFRMIPDSDPLKTYLEVVAESNPTFFTCWLGNNDVLGYATSGGAAGVDSPTAGITPTALFSANYQAVIDALTAGGGQGVVVTIPSVTDIPFFTTVPGQVIPLDAAGQAALTAGYADYNGLVDLWNASAGPGVQKRPNITFELGANYPVIMDDQLVDAVVNVPGLGMVTLPKMRKAAQGELILLSAQGALASGAGSASALGEEFVLTIDEQENIATAVKEYNDFIKSVATNNTNITVWDANTFFGDFVENGYQEGSIKMSSTFYTGGAFSLDGVHATPRGYALVANQLISTINSYFGVQVLPVKLRDYRTVKLQD